MSCPAVLLYFIRVVMYISIDASGRQLSFKQISAKLDTYPQSPASRLMQYYLWARAVDLSAYTLSVMSLHLCPRCCRVVICEYFSGSVPEWRKRSYAVRRSASCGMILAVSTSFWYAEFSRHGFFFKIFVDLTGRTFVKRVKVIREQVWNIGEVAANLYKARS